MLAKAFEAESIALAIKVIETEIPFGIWETLYATVVSTAFAILLGLPLGCWYDFLRPLRPRFTHLSDFVFMVGAVYLWLYQSFAICRGDMR